MTYSKYSFVLETWTSWNSRIKNVSSEVHKFIAKCSIFGSYGYTMLYYRLYHAIGCIMQYWADRGEISWDHHSKFLMYKNVSLDCHKMLLYIIAPALLSKIFFSLVHSLPIRHTPFTLVHINHSLRFSKYFLPWFKPISFYTQNYASAFRILSAVCLIDEIPRV